MSARFLRLVRTDHGERTPRNEWLIGVNPVYRSFFVHIQLHVNRIFVIV